MREYKEYKNISLPRPAELDSESIQNIDIFYVFKNKIFFEGKLVLRINDSNEDIVLHSWYFSSHENFKDLLTKLHSTSGISQLEVQSCHDLPLDGDQGNDLVAVFKLEESSDYPEIKSAVNEKEFFNITCQEYESWLRQISS